MSNLYDPATGNTIISTGQGPRAAEPLQDGRFHLALDRRDRMLVGHKSANSRARGAVLHAAKLPPRDDPAPRWTSRCITFLFSETEWRGIRRAAHGRCLEVWLREVVRVEYGRGVRFWTPCAEAFLRVAFRRLGLNEIQQALPGRTVSSIHHHAVDKLGLATTLSEDRLTVRHAARRAGVDPMYLRRKLCEQGTPPMLLAGTYTQAVKRNLVVRWIDVLRVVEGRRETPQSVGRRLGVSGQTVRETLKRLGSVKATSGHLWELSPEEVCRVEEYIRSETPEALARRLGTGPQRVRETLKRLGVFKTTPGHEWRLTSQEAQRVEAALLALGGKAPPRGGQEPTNIRDLEEFSLDRHATA